ncbi:restriction endonuclease subunit S [Patescibacteria group bacterium]|nr:restriction endonuclease subunit S [Patescibacteria group bacterium]MBU4017334.1 restriction endonuclease subunit S [Patescibacteria group bacterium]MBU4098758.1 restriction endonuclease subunit S [Patescibacteria group bacterium]
MTTPTKYQTYPKYKPSGINWLGDIPEGWEVKYLKYLLDRNDGGVWGEDSDNEGTPVLRSTEIDIGGNWKLEEFATRKLNPQDKQKALLKEGDLLITKSSGSELHIGKTAIVNKEIEKLECCFSNFMQRLRPKEGVSSKLLFYFFNSYVAREQYNFFSQNTTGLANLSEGLFGQIFFVKIPEVEQPTIVTFLDRETVRIDEVVAKKQKMMDLLKEKRQALITHAVTKGLDPKAKMKASGIDWLGDIPERWEVKRLKYIAKSNVSSLPENTAPDYLFKYLDIGNVGTGYILEEPIEIYFENAPSRARRIVKKNDTIISTVRTYLKAIYHFENDPKDMIVSTGFAVIEVGEEINPKFFYYLSLSENFIDSIVSNSYGVSYPAINESFLMTLPAWYPKIEEQKKIADFLDRETAKIDELMKKVETQIEKLKEYRQALISNVVTGKVMVT